MAGIVNYGMITPEQKKDIFDKTVLYLVNKRYDFSIRNGQGRLDYVELECPQLGMTLDLEFDAELSSSNIMCHFAAHYFMVNDLSQIINEIKKIEAEPAVDHSMGK